MSEALTDKKVAFLVADEGVEQVELTEPLEAVRDAGAEAHIVSPGGAEIQAFNHLDKGDTFTADVSVEEADPSDYDGLVLPGGVANPTTSARIPTRSSSSARSSTRASRLASSATARGR